MNITNKARIKHEKYYFSTTSLLLLPIQLGCALMNSFMSIQEQL